MATNKTTTREDPSNISKKYSSFPFPTRQNAITDEYELSNEALGVGINGQVLKCQHRITKQNCALKILKDTDKARREVIMHKKACANCPYIVQVLDIYEDIRESYPRLLIIMERMEGGELFDRIEQRKANPYTERDAANFISMIVQAVAHLHAMDMAHRDLKPENLLLTSKENNAILKLTDFGFAKEGNNELQPLITPCYTPYYVAPEVLSHKKYDKAVSEEAKSTIKRMLTVDPAERITIGEILNCSWLPELASERPIDMSLLRDDDNWKQMQTELASANDMQRRADDDVQVEILGPDASRTVKKRAAKKRDAEKK